MMFLLFNTLSRFVIAFLPRGKHLLISGLQSPSAVIFEPKKIKSATVSTFSPSICHEVMGLDNMILVFWMLSFKPAFLLSSVTLIKRLFSSSLFPAIRVVSFAYLRLLIFLLVILIPACNSSSPAFHMMYSAYKLNKQSDNMQTWCIPGLAHTFNSFSSVLENKSALSWGKRPQGLLSIKLWWLVLCDLLHCPHCWLQQAEHKISYNQADSGCLLDHDLITTSQQLKTDFGVRYLGVEGCRKAAEMKRK